MSVIVSECKESKFEAITYATELHDMIIDLMQRSFGIKDLDRFVRHVLCDEILLPEVRKKLIYDNFIDWLLTLIFDGFKIDVSYMTEKEYATCMTDLFNKNEYRKIPKEEFTIENFMDKSVNIGLQCSQIIGVYYPYRVDNYVRYVRSQKFYGLYMDDWYIINRSKDVLVDILDAIRIIAKEFGIHINEKKTRIIKISSTYRYLRTKYTLTAEGKIVKRINPECFTAMRRKLKKLALKRAKYHMIT